MFCVKQKKMTSQPHLTCRYKTKTYSTFHWLCELHALRTNQGLINVLKQSNDV